MAIASSYPMGTPKSGDLLLGTSSPTPGTDEKPTTRNFSIESVNALSIAPGILNATVIVTNAQIASLGTVPIAILPGVTGKAYQIIAASFSNGGSGTGSYDWGTSKGLLYLRTIDTATEHRLEVPTTSLPSGNSASAEVYMGIPTAGTSRVGSSLNFSTDDSVNPIPPFGATAIATITINLTYRLI